MADNPEELNKKSYFGLYILLSFGITWAFWVPDALGKRGILPDNFWTNLGFFGAFGPLIAAIIVTLKESGKSGLKQLFKKGIEHSFDTKWWIPIFGLFPLLIVIGFIIGIIIDSSVPPSEASGMWMYLPFIFFTVMFTSGPFQEEFGWRGYALPKLLDKNSLLKSSIILGVIWAVWHIPQFLVPKELTGMFYVTPFWSFFLTVLGANFVYSWIYVKTNRSVLPSLILHTQMNLFFWLFPVLSTTYGYLIILILFWISAAFIILSILKNKRL